MTLPFIDISQIIRDGGRGPERGLYVTFHSNEGAQPIIDRPGGKLIVGGGEHLMKSGRYLGKGLKHRLTSYHLWTRPGGVTRPVPSLFTGTLMSAAALDLSGLELPGGCNPAAAFEPLWNAAWQRWVGDAGLLLPQQNVASEYRRISSPAGLLPSAMMKEGERLGAMFEAMRAAMEPASPALRDSRAHE